MICMQLCRMVLSSRLACRATLGGLLAIAAFPGSVRATVVEGVQPAAVDQPRTTISFSRPATPTTPLVASGLGGPTIGVPAYYDTGASGIVIDAERASLLGIQLQTVNGTPALFSDIGAEGVIDFNISEPLIARIAPSLGVLDQLDLDRVEALSNPANFQTLYPRQTGPLRLQIGPVQRDPNPLPFTDAISVVGMPSMVGNVIVMHTAPTTNLFTLLDDDRNNDEFDAFMRTHTYSGSARPAFNPGNVNDPGIPVADRHVSLSYASFAKFTKTTVGAEAPGLQHNPFIGPNPLRAIDPTIPADNTPPITMRHNNQSFNGSFLLDTGAAASFISQQRAQQLGVTYDPLNGIGSENPRLLGVDVDKQFILTISGIGGGRTNIAGFFADEMLMRTDEGNPANDNDPNHIRFQGAPVLVFDISVTDPDTKQVLTLDGIFGMNFLAASADFEIPPGEIFPIFYAAKESPFSYVTFDEPNHKLGLVMGVPEPVVGTILLGSSLLLVVRPRRRPAGRRAA